MRISVRAAEAGDVSLLGDLWTSMVEHHRHLVGDKWPVHPPNVAWQRRREQYSAWLSDASGFIFLAEAEDVEAPVGYVACRLVSGGPTFDLGDVRGDVDSLVTAAAVRGQGVGSALLEACRGELMRRGVRYWSIGVVDANTRAIALYERLGFRPFVRSMLAPVDDDRSSPV